MDWFDTLWMILKKKSSVQMSFLHLYHHGAHAPPRLRLRLQRPCALDGLARMAQLPPNHDDLL